MEPASHTLAGLLTQLRAGGIADPELASKLDRAFAKHINGLRRYCLRELREISGAEADEVVQDVLLEAWRKLPEYRIEASFRSFLFGIASRKCANVRRKHRDALTTDGVIESQTDATVLYALLSAERDALVERAIESLAPDDQEIVHLRYVLDYSPEEIVSQLEIDPNDVRVALQRCKRRVQREITRLLAEIGHGPSFFNR